MEFQASQRLRELSTTRSQGHDLGMFQLANTAPSIFILYFNLALILNFGFSRLFIAFAELAVAAHRSFASIR